MGRIVSHRRINRILKQEELVSNKTVAQFHQQSYLNVVVSDLTYVRVGKR